MNSPLGVKQQTRTKIHTNMNTARHARYILTREGEPAPVGLIKYLPVSTFIRLLFSRLQFLHRSDCSLEQNKRKLMALTVLSLTVTLLIKFGLHRIESLQVNEVTNTTSLRFHISEQRVTSVLVCLCANFI